MALWVRFARDGGEGFGTLESEAVAVHTGDMLGRYPLAILVAYAADQEQARDTVRQITERFGPDRIVTGLDEFDRVCGGGVVPGSAIGDAATSPGVSPDVPDGTVTDRSTQSRSG